MRLRRRHPHHRSSHQYHHRGALGDGRPGGVPDTVAVLGAGHVEPGLGPAGWPPLAPQASQHHIPADGSTDLMASTQFARLFAAVTRF
jgi:hypothetical protein